MKDEDQQTNPFIHEDTGRRNLTALKKQQEEIHERIEKMIALKAEERAALPIDAEGKALLKRIASMKHGDPRSREMRYAARCYAEWDDAGIQALLRDREYRHSIMLDLEAVIKDWHQKLLEDGSQLTTFIEQYPAAKQDTQRLRQLVRNAGKEYKAELAALAALAPDEKPSKKLPNKSTQALIQAIRLAVRA